MFAERFDTIMNIAEVSNAELGRAVDMNGSHISRFRTGARALPKKHGFLTPMCQYLASRIRKEYQFNALQKLTGIGPAALATAKNTASYLEQWLVQKDKDSSAATGRLITGFSRLTVGAGGVAALGEEKPPAAYKEYLYGDDGKRKAVEQFFLRILQEEAPQTLLLFSDEDMSWLSGDASFAIRWSELFKKVIMKGNRVRIVHTLSRDMDHLLWSVTNWLPIYMTGAVEAYCYPRLRDRLCVSVLDPAHISDSMLETPLFGLHGTGRFALTREEYMACFNRLIKLDKQCENLSTGIYFAISYRLTS